MEELVQRILRQAPQWVWQLLTVCALSGLALKSLADVFRPAIAGPLAEFLDPAQINTTNCMFISLCVVGPTWFVAHLMDPDRVRKRAVLSQINLVEDAMDRAQLREPERVTVRRQIIRALAEASKDNMVRITAADVANIVNQEMPNLLQGGQTSG